MAELNPTKLKITNFKAINLLEVDLNKQCFVLLGKNGKGKSSVLQAMRISMGIEQLPEHPVQWGKEKGAIETTFKYDDETYHVKVEFTDESSKFSFTDAAGAPIKKEPKTMLKRMVGPTLDIFRLIEDSRTADGKRKMEKYFLEIGNLDIDKIEDFGKKIGSNEEARLRIGRERDLKKGLIDEYKDLDTELYAEKKDVKPLYDKFNKDLADGTLPETGAHTLKAEKLKEKKDKSELLKKLADKKEEGVKVRETWHAFRTDESNAERMRDEITSLEMKLQELKANLKELSADIEKRRPEVNKLRTPEKVLEQYRAIEVEISELDKDNEAIEAEAQALFNKKLSEITEDNKNLKDKLTLELEQSVSVAEAHNAEHGKVLVLRERKRELNICEEDYENLTGLIVKLRDERRRYIMTGTSPIKELEYTDTGFKYKGMDLDERVISASEIIELGVMVNDYLNPEGLRFMGIPNASLFDKDHFVAVQKYLVKRGLVGAFEMVTSSDDTLRIEFLEDPAL